ncbi:SAM-dependent methyltransferase [Actibacterium pelagium]|uniref:Cyclopropane-fatty-acyl-phospholipid synthase n=1 Tax=Actibacterium pelagium TaxID=2029103 RepID=A0A917EGP0_9RHOB|nr:cyclopropane-fatty-acyl-phospholipid synthase family protein [Actibacterium pelagium]GGE38705.1 cyclopropane-fatty-acyl-phospholipid synthase [Actibacterium pelagium]
MGFVSNRIKHEFLETCEGIKIGSLRLITPEGTIHDFGAGEPQAEMKINDWGAVTAIAARGDIGMGEAYVAGLWDTPSIETLTTVALRNMDHLQAYVYGTWWSLFKHRMIDVILRANSKRGSAKNIQAHYDVGNEFYQLWLDPSMTYSSALFDQGETDLQLGQYRKYDRILGRLEEGERVLEIGCGWGGFAERAADEGRHVTGVTISPSQKGYADARLDGRAEIQLQDYRDVKGKFDNIVSIEMIEAVGERYWPNYFGTLRDRLAEGGRAVVQAITVPDAYFDIYRRGSDYIRQYTFPGGMLLSDAVISDQARRAGLKVTDNFAFGRDYAQTCRMWGERLQAKRDKIAKLGYGDSFLRNWEFYLAICAASFEVGQTNVVQVELRHA